MDTIDINALALPSGVYTPVSVPQAPPKPKRTQMFLKGPVPWAWLERAGRLPGRAMAVAIILWHLVGMRKTSTVKWQPVKARGMGIDRHAVYRALQSLEEAGLVTMERKPGQCPIISIQDITGEEA